MGNDMRVIGTRTISMATDKKLGQMAQFTKAIMSQERKMDMESSFGVRKTNTTKDK